MTKETLNLILSSLGVVSVGGEFKARCPVCQSPETPVEKYSMVVSPGVSKVAVFYCFKCCLPKNREHNRNWLASVNKKLQIPIEISETLDRETIQKLWSFSPEQISDYTERADTNLISSVYSALLKRLELRNEHRKWLGRRGFVEDTAWELGYRSTPLRSDERTDYYIDGDEGLFGNEREFTDGELLSVPGFTRDYTGQIKLLLREYAILIPCRDTKGRIVALKQRMLDGKKGRMRLLSCSFSGGSVAVNGCHCPVGVGDTQWSCLWITEGERKADVWWQGTGNPTIALPGINAWRLVLPVLPEVATKKTKLVLALDCDGKEATEKTQQQLITELVAEGYTDIEEASWRNAKGLDDAFVEKSDIEVNQVDIRKYHRSQLPTKDRKYDFSKVKKLRQDEIIPYLKQEGPKLLSEVPAYLPELIGLINAGLIRKIDYTKRGPILAAR